jgi:hypothetical protein
MSCVLRIQVMAVESLIPYARNARTHSDAQVAQIAASIKEFGFATAKWFFDCRLRMGVGS